jgi:hypothetical protein
VNGALLALLLRCRACIGGGEDAPQPPQPSEDFELVAGHKIVFKRRTAGEAAA